MSAFGGLILTNKGRNLQAKAQSGAQLNFTRIGVGDGDLAGSSILELNALKHEVKTLSITKLKSLTGGKAAVGGMLTNQGLVSGFYWRELGLFAQDPDLGEVLYCYGNSGANAEYIPADGGADVLEKSIDIISIVGNAANVTATIDQSLVYATTSDIQSLQGQIDSHKADYTMQIPYGGTTLNNGNAYTIATPAITALTAGMAISLKINADSAGAATLNWNGTGAKGIKKANGNDVVNLKANGIYTFRYDGTNFILQGEGGEYGTAGAPQVLQGYTVGTENGLVGGTVNLSNLVASNVRENININGTIGTLVPLIAASGNAIYNNTGGVSTTITITGLTFKPVKVIVKFQWGDGMGSTSPITANYGFSSALNRASEGKTFSHSSGNVSINTTFNNDGFSFTLSASSGGYSASSSIYSNSYQYSWYAEK